MGKRYYCDYCDKTMPCNPSIIKTHNSGLLHQRVVKDHYQKFKKPEEILAEESAKKPCNRFAMGTCQFGSICRYSHYTREQMQSLKDYVSTKKLAENITAIPCFRELYHKLQTEKSHNDKNSSVLVDSNGVTHLLPWTYNDAFESYGELPPSLKKITIDDFKNATITDWG